MSLREEMQRTLSSMSIGYYKTDYGQFTRWWYKSIGKISSDNTTFISHMLKNVTSDEELELLWAQWNIEREE